MFPINRAKKMKIAVFGLGYVGCVGIGCLAQNGHQLIGVDINDEKIDLVNKGIPTIIEKDIDSIMKQQWCAGKISATKDYRHAVLETDVAFICVGTPSLSTGQLNLDYVYETARQIGESLRQKEAFYVVAIRSTVLPGTNQKIGEIISKASGKARNQGFAVVSNPEFLREGTAVEDYYNPPVTVIGTDNDKAFELMVDIYEKVNDSVKRVEINVAEIIKYVNNSYHALKIVFANEVGNICKKIGIDSYEVMRLFCMDKQLNISPYYFKPGFAYGGSCLPKDLKALNMLAHDNYIEVPMLQQIENSNKLQKEKVLKIIESKKVNKITVLGISFKSGTDDLRNSPIVEVIEMLIGKGYELKLYDKNVQLSKLIGKNKSYIMEKLPHIEQYITDDPHTAIDWADLIILTYKDETFKALNINKSKIIIDLVYYSEFFGHENYIGLCW
jgi:GDP-mannose 6-dehydrogenase